MARIRKSATLDSREARTALRARQEPYWHRIEQGLFLGYRKSKAGGRWIVRRYRAAAAPGESRYVEKALGRADDHRKADGAEVLDFGQAQRRILSKAEEQALDASGQRYTVADAVRDYLDWLHRNRKSGDATEVMLNAYVGSSSIAGKRLADLTAADFDAWLAWALKRRRRTRRKTGEARAAAVETESKAQAADRGRRRRATINRVINGLKACLNHAATAGKPANPDAWARLKKFRSADSARLRWLTVDEAQRLQNAARADLRALVSAGLNTGCRAGELLALRAGDYDSRSNTLLIADSKSGKPRRVPLTDDGVALFERLTAGKPEDESLFPRADGSSWYRVALVRAMRSACSAAKVRPAATFHTLRHTYASHLVQAGVPLIFVAETLGHSDARMVTKHYGHLAPSHVADAIRAALPKFGGAAAHNVTDLRARKA
ncbi:MAG: site-specific integrase [Steroidobacteraceae bacterium]